MCFVSLRRAFTLVSALRQSSGSSIVKKAGKALLDPKPGGDAVQPDPPIEFLVPMINATLAPPEAGCPIEGRYRPRFFSCGIAD